MPVRKRWATPRYAAVKGLLLRDAESDIAARVPYCSCLNGPERLTPPFVETVGVFVAASAADMRAAAAKHSLRAVQWHGGGSPPQ